MQNDVNNITELKNKRNELKQRFVNLEGNYDIVNMRTLQTDLEDYLDNHEDNFNKDIENTLYLVKSCLNYALTDDIVSSYDLALPMLTNLEFGSDIEKLQNKYNKALLTGSIFVCKDYKQSFELVEAIEKSLEVYPVDTNLKEDFLMWAYANYAEMLLNTKYFVKLSESELLEVEEEFYKYSEIVKELSKKIHGLV